jgi:O-antigen/teichoic acid export membrane protein
VSRLATLTTRLLVLACLPLVGAAIGGASTIVTTVLGADFTRSAPVLAVGSITVAGWVCMVPTGYAILARRHDQRYLAATVSAAVTSLPLIVMLGSVWGISGIAVAMLLAEVVAAVVIAAGAARSDVRLGLVPVAVAVAVAFAVAITAGVAAAAAPWGIVGVVAVGVLAESPFLGAVVLEIRRARHSVLGGGAAVVD